MTEQTNLEIFQQIWRFCPTFVGCSKTAGGCWQRSTTSTFWTDVCSHQLYVTGTHANTGAMKPTRACVAADVQPDQTKLLIFHFQKSKWQMWQENLTHQHNAS